MLIGIDASRANKKHKTGTEWYSYYLIRWLAKLDNKNQYILYSDTPLTGGLLDLGTPQYFPDSGCYEKIEFDQNGYQIIKSPNNNFKAKVLNWPFSFFWTQGRLSLEMVWHRPDILFVPSHTLPIIHPKKSVATIHDVAFESDQNIYQQEKVNEGAAKNYDFIINALVFLFTLGKYRANNIDYLRWSTKFGLKHAKKVITVSNYSKNDLIRWYRTDDKKLNVIYNGYNSFIFKKNDDQATVDKILAKYGINKPYLFYVGRIEKKKNIPKLIEAFSLLKQEHKDQNHKLVLAGKASYGYDEVTYSIQEFGLAGDIIMTGWVEENDLPYLFSGATAFVFPSCYEGFGIPLLQAMACGTPIITSCSTSIPEVVGEAALLTNPLSAKSMSDAMAKIINEAALRERLIEAGQERIKSFSWQKCAEETLKLLNSLV